MRKYRGLFLLAAIAVTAIILEFTGLIMRHTLLSGLPQYDDAADIAIPFMLLADDTPLQQKRERERWEQAHAATNPAETDPKVTDPVITDPGPSGSEATAPLPSDTTPETTVPPTTEPVNTEPRDESYFDNTLFIGNSRTEGLALWGRLGKADYFATTGLTVFGVLDEKASDQDFGSTTLLKLLETNDYDQVYITLGINECGYNIDTMMDQYEYVLQRVQQAEPEARIVLQAILHCGSKKSSSASYFSVAHLEEINGRIKELANFYDNVYFLDCNDLFTDENGYLISEYSEDGCHFKAKYYDLWAQAILERSFP